MSEKWDKSNVVRRTDRDGKPTPVKAKEGKKESLNAWGQDEKTAKGIRKQLRQEKKMKAFNKGAEARYKAGY